MSNREFPTEEGVRAALGGSRPYMVLKAPSASNPCILDIPCLPSVATKGEGRVGHWTFESQLGPWSLILAELSKHDPFLSSLLFLKGRHQLALGAAVAGGEAEIVEDLQEALLAQSGVVHRRIVVLAEE
jgi:hypothetical protein